MTKETLQSWEYGKMVSSYELVKAVASNNIKSVKTHLQKGVELNPIYDITPLAQASRMGNLEMMKLLIEAGADVNHQMDDDRETALMEAVAAGHLDAVKMLIEAGADVNLKDIYQSKAISIAAYNADEEIFNYLEPLTIPKWEPGTKILDEAKRRKKIRNVKGVWVNTDEV